MIINPVSPAPRNAESPAAISEKLEAAFLEEMLKYCGPKSSEGAFSGGAGEAQFASFLSRSYAEALAARLDLGLGGTLGRVGA